MDYLHFANTESGFRLLLTSIRHQEYLCLWVIRTQSPQQLDGLRGQYNSQGPIVQV